MAGSHRVIQGLFLGGRPRLAGGACALQPSSPFAGRAAAPHVAAALGRAPRTASAPPPPVAQPYGHVFTAPPDLLRLSSGRPGQPLPETIQRRMKEVLGSDFSDVRVHVGPEAPAIGALAFTYGSQVFFAPGQWNPATPHGQRLIAHELTHVVQQRQGRVRNPLGTGVAVVQDPGLEAEAERMSLRVLTPTPARETAGTLQARLRPLRPGTIQRAAVASGGTGGSSTGGGTSKYSDTNFYDGQIYAIIQNHDLTFVHHGKNIDGNRKGETVYVGQTLQDDVGTRFIQHVNEDADQPWHRDIWPDQGYTYQSADDNDWPYYPRELWNVKQQTRLETSADEQFYYEHHGGLSGSLLNKITPLTQSTFLSYKSSSTFRGTGYPSSWKPKK